MVFSPFQNNIRIIIHREKIFLNVQFFFRENGQNKRVCFYGNNKSNPCHRKRDDRGMTLIIVFSPDVAVAAPALPGTGGNDVLHREHDQLHTGFFIGFHKIISFLSPSSPL